QRISAAATEHHRVDTKSRRVAEDGTQVLVVVDPLEHYDGPGAIDHLRDAELGRPTRRGQNPAIEMKTDYASHYLGRHAVVGSRAADQICLELGEPTVGAEKGQWREPGCQHALHHEHTLGDHQPLPGRQIGPTVDAVEIPEIVEPRVVG